MLNGFVQTEPLTGYELEQLLPAIVRDLRHHVGEAQAVKNDTIVKALTKHGYRINTARVRKIINHIRCCGYIKCLVANSKGYFVATRPDEMSAYIDSLKGREQAIGAVRASMEQQLCEWQDIINQKNIITNNV